MGRSIRRKSNEKFGMTTIKDWVELRVEGMTSHKNIKSFETKLLVSDRQQRPTEHFEHG